MHIFNPLSFLYLAFKKENIFLKPIFSRCTILPEEICSSPETPSNSDDRRRLPKPENDNVY